MAITDQLKQLGLNHSEISVYLFLLENGISTPPIVSRRTNIARTNCYNILNELVGKGLIAEQLTGKRKAYIANDPESLLRGLERKKEIVSQILPDLRGLFTTQKNKPRIRFFDGVAQIKELYQATLGAKQILGFASTNKLLTLMPKLFEDYNNELKKRGIFFKDILSAESRTHGAPEMAVTLRGLYSVRFLDPRRGDFPTDMLVWDNSVALITLDEPVFGTILTSRTLANTFRIIHEVMWNATT